MKDASKENISLVAIWNEPSFEEMLLCGSVPKGQVGELISRDGVKNCYHHGDAELETVRLPGREEAVTRIKAESDCGRDPTSPARVDPA